MGDQAAGVIMPFYDEDLNLLYLAGKGDGNIRYFELVDDKSWFFHVSEFRDNSPCRGMAMLPKRACDVMKCEVAKMLKLGSNEITPLNFICPRKSDLFQEDLFPDAYAGQSAMSAEDFFGGKSKKPVLMSLDPDKRTDVKKTDNKPAMKKVKTAKELQKELDKANARIKELEAKLKKHNISI